jgi:glycosyl transferase, family 25
MIKTYVINLPEATDRRQFVEAQLRFYPFLRVEYVAAIRGSSLSEKELSERVDPAECRKTVGRELGSGEIGCALSHIKVMEKVVTDGEPAALVLEDDAVLSGMLHRIIGELEAQILSPAPRVILLTPCEYVAAGGQILSHGYAIRPVHDAFYAAGYLVNREAALRISARLLPVAMPADWWKEIRGRTGIELGALVPYCVGLSVSENSTSSTTDAPKTSTEETRSLLNALLESWRRVVRGIFVRVHRIKAQRITF